MTDKATSDLWWKNAVIYCADVATWLDSDGDGTGDLAGLTRRLDYLWGLGINTLWLMPFYLDEMHKVLDFWLELGVDGFRVDSLPFMIETVGTDAKDQPVTYLRSLVEFLERRRGNAISWARPTSARRSSRATSP